MVEALGLETNDVTFDEENERCQSSKDRAS
jgi:hypothetical protein